MKVPVRILHPFIPPLAVLLMASGSAGAQGVLIDRSEIRFVSKQMGINVEGKFRRWKANVDFKPADLACSRADFEIDLASVALGSEEAETVVKRPRWFDTSKFPLAKFESTGLKALGDNRYEIAGTLTLKGQSRDIAIPVLMKRDPAGNEVAEGAFTLQRLDFNLGDGQWADPDVVADDVQVKVKMVLPRAA